MMGRTNTIHLRAVAIAYANIPAPSKFNKLETAAMAKSFFTNVAKEMFKKDVGKQLWARWDLDCYYLERRTELDMWEKLGE